MEYWKRGLRYSFDKRAPAEVEHKMACCILCMWWQSSGSENF